MTIIAPNLVGLPPMLSQGVAFLFFLLIYVGVALGVARYRLFQLDEWAFRILIGVQLMGALYSRDQARKDLMIRGTLSGLREIISNAPSPVQMAEMAKLTNLPNSAEKARFHPWRKERLIAGYPPSRN